MEFACFPYLEIVTQNSATVHYFLSSYIYAILLKYHVYNKFDFGLVFFFI